MDSAVSIAEVGRKKRGRGDVALPVTEPWRDAANAEILRRGRGAHAATARAAKCKPPTLTLILNGTTAVSTLVGPISDHLDIPLPHEVRRTPDEIEVNEKYPKLGKDGKRLILEMIRQLEIASNSNK